MSNATETQIAPSPGLRERKKEQTRERLRSSAFQLFTERGYDNVTVDEVAEHAEVSKSTLFRYFETKEDLVLADSRAHGQLLMATFAERPTDEPVLASLRAALVSVVAGLQGDRQRFLQRTLIVADAPTLSVRALERQAAWEDDLTALILPRLQGRDDAETRASVLAAASLAVLRVATRRWAATDDGSQLIDHLLPALDVLADELKGSD